MLAFLTTLVLATPPGIDPFPAAMIVRIDGTIEIEAPDGSRRRAAAMDLVSPGERIHALEKGYVLLVFFDDRHLERLEPGAGATVRREGCSPSRAVERPSNAPAFAAVPFKDVRPLRASGRGAGVVFR